MNSTASQYDNIAQNYNLGDRFGSFNQSHACALEQIKDAKLGEHRQHFKILDLGVGDGVFLSKIKQIIPQAELTGIDLSKEMLKKAKEILDFHDILGNSMEADKLLPLHQQDLVIAHFINAYMPMQTLLQQAKWMSKANGYFSYITTTYESFPNAQQQLAKFVAKDSFLSSIVGHYYKKIVQQTPVASGQEEIIQQLHHFNFDIISHQRIHLKIRFENIEEMIEFGNEGSWFLNVLSAAPFNLGKKFLLERIPHFFNKIFTFPFEDEHIIDIFLTKK